ncbi:MAG: CDP-diacylglycerol--glycerol-3-phosphate 3-phosphatidyltransferase [Pseudomonadales bacterium]
MNIPNALTLFRIALIPVFVLIFYLPWQWASTACSAIFIVAALTDWLDGYLARKWEQSTPFGAFLDPVADKLMVAIALVLLVSALPDDVFKIPVTIAAMVIIGREIVISALREWMAELGKRASVAVSMVGKVKTTLQMIAIIVLLAAGPAMPFFVRPLGNLLLFVAAGLTLWSMVVYLRAASGEFGLGADNK